MKTKITAKMIFTLSICLFTIISNAQDASVEKSTYGLFTYHLL